VIKLEPYNCDDYEWISDGPDELVKYDVVEETVAEWSDKPDAEWSDKPPSRSSRSSLVENSLSDSAFSSFFESGKIDVSLEEEKPPIVEVVPVRSKSSGSKLPIVQVPVPDSAPETLSNKCPCCFSALQKFKGPLKKRILMAVRSMAGNTEEVAHQVPVLSPDARVPVTPKLERLDDSSKPSLPSSLASSLPSSLASSSTLPSSSSFISPIPSPPPPPASTTRASRRAARNSASNVGDEENSPAANESVSEIVELSGESFEGDLQLVPSPTSKWRKIVVRVDANEGRERTIHYQIISSRGGERVSQSEWGYVRFQEFCLPFIYKFGLAMFPVKILVTTVFEACRCMIPKCVLNRILAAQGTILVSWEEVQRIEKEHIVRSTGVRNGDKLLKVHLFFEGYYDMMEEVKKRHEAAKLNSSKKICKWLNYIEENPPMEFPFINNNLP